MQNLEVSLKLPDLWQQEAIRALQDGRDVVVDAPTGAGKTYIFELLLAGGFQGDAVYTVPTRALANDKLLEWRAKRWNVGITTGDITENVDAPVVVATLEAQKGRFLRGEGPALLVIDEYQMIADESRGVNYELSIALTPPDTQLLLMSGSVGNPQHAVAWLRKLGRDAVLISTRQRPVPLDEVYAEALPDNLPPSVRGFWPRLIGRALKEGMGPMLVFAPRRKSAEGLARQLAAALPEDDPLELTQEQRRLAGDVLAKLLRARIAYHHSGLDYKQRAGLIEPLAKAGQLRVVVATMGLSSGINFSLRSVMVTDREYRAGERSHLVRPDELLQMFGRAGRRGLDKRGYVVVAPDKPKLSEARPIMLRRTNQVDWPSLIAVMAVAADRGEDPRAAARALAGRLFSQQRVPLGLESFVPERPAGAGRPAARQPVPSARSGHQSVIEIMNSEREWERRRSPRKARLADCLVHENDEWCPALSLPRILAAIGTGSICKLETQPELRYGRELPVARLGDDPAEGELVLTKWLHRRLRELLEAPRLSRRKWTLDELEERIYPHLPALTEGGAFYGIVERNGTFYIRLDYGEVEAFAHIDSHGAPLLDPPQREQLVFYDLGAGFSAEAGPSRNPSSPAEAWYQLGLIDEDARPTRRGRVFCCFNHGEGLAIAAALEDERYPIEEIVFDLANLRAGHRFAQHERFSGRLGTVCRAAYKEATHPGYLRKGLPTDYGDGAAEILAALARNPHRLHELTNEDLSSGDIERARLEWRSLLNHCAHAPDVKWDRWLKLKRNARQLLETLGPPLSLDFPPLTPQQRQRHKSFLKFD